MDWLFDLRGWPVAALDLTQIRNLFGLGAAERPLLLERLPSLGPDLAEPELRAAASLAEAACRHLTGMRSSGATASQGLRAVAAVFDAGDEAHRFALADLAWTLDLRRIQFLRSTAARTLPEGLRLSARELDELDELAETEYYVRRANLEAGRIDGGGFWLLASAGPGVVADPVADG